MERKPSYGMVEEKREQILDAAQCCGARNVRLFGSLARGEGKADSDFDILCEFEPTRTLLDQVELALRLEKILGRKVDVVTPNMLNEQIRKTVLNEAIQI